MSSILKAWEKKLSKSEWGKNLLIQLERELSFSNLKDSVRDGFYSRFSEFLSTKYKDFESINPRDVFVEYCGSIEIQDKLGPLYKDYAKLGKLYHYKVFKSFFDDILRGAGYKKDDLRKAEAEFSKGRIPSKYFSGRIPRHPKFYFWVTTDRSVNEIKKDKSKPYQEKVVESLGLAHLNNDLVVEISFLPVDNCNVFKPTLLFEPLNPYFCPACSSSKLGKALDLYNISIGSDEGLHSAMNFDSKTMKALPIGKYLKSKRDFSSAEVRDYNIKLSEGVFDE